MLGNPCGLINTNTLAFILAIISAVYMSGTSKFLCGGSWLASTDHMTEEQQRNCLVGKQWTAYSYSFWVVAIIALKYERIHRSAFINVTIFLAAVGFVFVAQGMNHFGRLAFGTNLGQK